MNLYFAQVHSRVDCSSFLSMGHVRKLKSFWLLLLEAFGTLSHPYTSDFLLKVAAGCSKIVHNVSLSAKLQFTFSLLEYILTRVYIWM